MFSKHNDYYDNCSPCCQGISGNLPSFHSEQHDHEASWDQKEMVLLLIGTVITIATVNHLRIDRVLSGVIIVSVHSISFKVCFYVLYLS